MRIGVVFTGAVVVVVFGVGIKWGEFFEPDAKVMVQPALIIVDENRGGDVQLLTSTIPSCTPLLRIAFSTSGVILRKPILVGKFSVK